MFCGIKRGLDSLLDHYAAVCIALALFILSLVGVGDMVTVSLLGLLLCMVGLTRRSARVDLWILVPLLVYDLFCLVSSYAAYGNIADGYGVTHAIFPLLCLLTACLDQGERRLLGRLCVLWVSVAAGAGIAGFVFQAVTQGRVGRMGGLLGNPNAMGIFLVLGWAIALDSGSFLEPLLLIGAAMTLSMGSFVAMAAGILVLLADKKRTASWGETVRYGCQLLAKASLGVGTGLLLYLSAARTRVPWVCLLLAAYAGAVLVLWKDLGRFLEAKPRMAALIAALGVLVALAAVLIRPSAVATFAERLEMMASGLHYLTADPLVGVGPFQWRLLDLHDGGKYFNTWHIHNVPLHVGVETGWIAMAALCLAGLRALDRRNPLRAMTAAFLVHNLLDTSFFYLGVTALVLTAAGCAQEEGHTLGGGGTKVLFALLAGLFAYGLYYTVTAG